VPCRPSHIRVAISPGRARRHGRDALLLALLLAVVPAAGLAAIVLLLSRP
jgi:hypothetical protein